MTPAAKTTIQPGDWHLDLGPRPLAIFLKLLQAARVYKALVFRVADFYLTAWVLKHLHES
jgi:hypothetical protein